MNNNSGVKHWIHQRVTAVAGLPLMVWLIYSIIKIQNQEWSFDVFSNWLSTPLNGVLMILSIVLIFYHAVLGLEVIVEDYVHDKALRKLSLMTIKFSFALMVLVSVLSVLKVMFGS